MIIIEGADLVGKTTLCKTLVEDLRVRLKVTYAHCHLGRLGDGDRCDEYIRLLNRWQVWDRFHLSEIAYRSCDDVRSLITPKKYTHVDNFIKALGGVIIVITAEEATVRSRHAKIGDDVYSLDHILRVNEFFRALPSPSDRHSERHVIVRDQVYCPKIDMFLSSETLECPSNLKLISERIVNRVSSAR